MSDVHELLGQVQRLRSMLTDVGTGQLRIQDGEADYTSLRSVVSAELRALSIADPNSFHSLWDWYGYWKANDLNSYQSRREYVSTLYRPVIEALEGVISGASQQPAEAPFFSRRHGFSPDHSDPPVTIYEDAPSEMRRVLLDIATKNGWDPDELLAGC